MAVHGMKWACDLMMWSLYTRIEKSFSYSISYSYLNLMSGLLCLGFRGCRSLLLRVAWLKKAWFPVKNWTRYFGTKLFKQLKTKMHFTFGIGNWPQYGARFRKTQNMLTGFGIRIYLHPRKGCDFLFFFTRKFCLSLTLTFLYSLKFFES